MKFLYKTKTAVFFTDTVEILEPEEPTLEHTKNNVTCPGGTNGSFIVIIETVSVAEDYEYSLNGGDYQPDSTFTDLPAGIYTVNVRNPDSCVFTITVEITEPGTPQPEMIIENESCDGSDDGTLTVNLPDSLGTFEFSLDGIVYQDTNTFENLGAGNYDLHLMNSSGCVSTHSFEITAPEAPDFTIETNSVTCNGGNDGEIEVTVNSGVSPYEYALNGGTFQSSNIFSNLTAGDYTLTVRDGNNCSFDAIVTVAEPNPMTSEITGENETCSYENGWATILVEGGTSPYVYDWSNGVKNPVITDLSEATYKITITDHAGCVHFDSILLKNEAAPIVGAEINDVSCKGEENGWISLEIESESYPLKYYWSNGEDRSQIANLKAANYSVTVIDDNNCYSSETFTVNEPKELTLDTEFEFEKSKGSVNLKVEGGTAPFEYYWSNGSTEEDLRDVEFGVYEVTVTDSKGCEKSASFRVFDPNQHLKDRINVYPVPTFDELSIEMILPGLELVQISLLDELGRELIRLDEREIEEETIILNLENLAGAMYMLRLQIGEDVIVKRIIKQSE